MRAAHEWGIVCRSKRETDNPTEDSLTAGGQRLAKLKIHRLNPQNAEQETCCVRSRRMSYNSECALRAFSFSRF
jgi:hypothetical protein